LFKNRKDAGKKLGNLLKKYGNEKPVILALPRGGVIVAYEVAKILKAPLDVIVSRKIGAPSMPEYGIGAVSEGANFLDKKNASDVGLKKDQLDVLIKLQEEEVNRRVKLYRNGKKLPKLSGKTVIIVDDGLATGVTAHAAIEAIKKLKAGKIIFAAPVCDRKTAESMRGKIEAVECISFPSLFSIGFYYLDFEQVSDQEVIEVLSKSRKRW